MRGSSKAGRMGEDEWPDPSPTIPEATQKIILYDSQERPLTRPIGFKPAERKEAPCVGRRIR
jgi:hypothetical protein